MKALKNRWLEKYNQEQQEEIQQLSNQQPNTELQCESYGGKTQQSSGQKLGCGQELGCQSEKNKREKLSYSKRHQEVPADETRQQKRGRLESSSGTVKKQRKGGKEKTEKDLIDKQDSISKVVKCKFEGFKESMQVELQEKSGSIIELLRVLKKIFNIQKLDDGSRITYRDVDGDWLLLSESTPWQHFVQNVQQLNLVVDII
eukprot:TRINITY_DN3069_c0_g1_i3.p2 TRINITY_DN3069_c0_g1~~TRINITY_DN3069_c0_g1_i3.p2  ORF type:complete len:202 (-),score=25.77 TRINITY_DN3069_c0_g1_i3:303-908(-)